MPKQKPYSGDVDPNSPRVTNSGIPAWMVDIYNQLPSHEEFAGTQAPVDVILQGILSGLGSLKRGAASAAESVGLYERPAYYSKYEQDAKAEDEAFYAQSPERQALENQIIEDAINNPVPPPPLIASQPAPNTTVVPKIIPVPIPVPMPTKKPEVKNKKSKPVTAEIPEWDTIVSGLSGYGMR